MSPHVIGPWGHLLQSAYVILSLGILAMAQGLHTNLRPRARNRLSSLLLITAAAALCIIAYVWMDMPGVPVTLQGRVHHGAARTAFLWVALASAWQTRCLRHDSDWRKHLARALPWAVGCCLSLGSCCGVHSQCSAWARSG